MEQLVGLVDQYYQRAERLRLFLQSNNNRILSGMTTPDLALLNTSVNNLSDELDQTHQSIIALTKLSQEFSRYRYVMRMLEEMQRGLNSKQQYEGRNILERWLINLANDSEPIFSERKLAENYPATEKMRQEMQEKGIGSEQKVDRILQLGREYVRLPEIPVVNNVRMVGGGIQVDDKLFELEPRRMQLLLRLDPSVEKLAVVLVRYASLLPYGQQWSIPKVVYQYLVNRYGASVEGFASPINSQIITVRSDLKFCSLFPDIDSPYGSIGSFFNPELDTYFYNRTTVINPPFVPAVLDRMAARVNQLCDNATEPVRFFVWVPDWTDAEWFGALMNSRHRVFETRLNRGNYYYTDVEGKRIPANFPSHIFVLAVNFTDDYRDLTRKLLELYR